MISVIAGKYRGRKLFDVKNLHVRPTQAKVRKSIFQILEPFQNLEVLDLYAGMGTLGIEALSRGASKVVFVEKNRKVFKVLKKNINLFDAEKSYVVLEDVSSYLKRVKNHVFDIVLADPPYSEVSFESIQKSTKHFLKPGGILCMEMKRESIDNDNVRIKHYGSSQVVFWRNIA